MKIVGRITAEDITNGQRQICERCPLALALNRVLPKGYVAEVFESDIIVFRPNAISYDYIGVNHTDETREFIYRFDRQMDVDELDFVFDMPRLD